MWNRITLTSSSSSSPSHLFDLIARSNFASTLSTSARGTAKGWRLKSQSLTLARNHSGSQGAFRGGDAISVSYSLTYPIPRPLLPDYSPCVVPTDEQRTCRTNVVTTSTTGIERAILHEGSSVPTLDPIARASETCCACVATDREIHRHDLSGLFRTFCKKRWSSTSKRQERETHVSARLDFFTLPQCHFFSQSISIISLPLKKKRFIVLKYTSYTFDKSLRLNSAM